MNAFAIGRAVFALVVLIGRHGGRDATDPPDGRSGLGLYTDHATGCQYLSAGPSGITPRLSKDGKHICDMKP